MRTWFRPVDLVGGDGMRTEMRRAFSRSVGGDAVETCCECGGAMRGATRVEACELVGVLGAIEWPECIVGMCPLGAAVCGCCGHVKVMLWGRGGGLVWCPGFGVNIHPGRTI